ncbi:hypothetical protein DSO57_1013860 [Entomophthora muscae]|uniref:Uncharacterized protein n=1 Tax=Entomophthora muscae TaxID=34485 RepID=A0ACC2U3X0_9FUNG|nr:hypothetical protein DSO57_1013860 [Entomophthora muscae]
MEPHVTLKPMPAPSPDLSINHTDKLFEIVYITLTGVIDTIILAAGLWSWVGKSFSYLFKLAPLLWWALPAKNLAQVIPENNGPAAQDWVPDSEGYWLGLFVCLDVPIKVDGVRSMIIYALIGRNVLLNGPHHFKGSEFCHNHNLRALYGEFL